MADEAEPSADREASEPGFAEYATLSAPVLVWFGTAACLAARGVAADIDFFRAAASVIPTLLLTLAIQLRFFAPSPSRTEMRGRSLRARFGAWVGRWQLRIFGGQVLALIVLGEGWALFVLGSEGHPHILDTVVVAGAIAAAFCGIVGAALRGPVTSE